MRWVRVESEVRFWLMIKSGPGCWEWQGGRANGCGYGAMRLGKAWMMVHRYSWTIHHGPIPTGLLVCHKCDNPLCVRPDHLFLGTNKQNCQDKVSKNRQAFNRGELCGTSILTEQAVKAIRYLSARGVPNRVMADAFNVHIDTVGLAVSRKTWAHVE